MGEAKLGLGPHRRVLGTDRIRGGEDGRMPTRRLVIWLGAPLVVVGGLALLWGVRNAAALKAQIEVWADSLRHSAHPVVMELGFLPAYVEGRRVGTLRTVIVQRDRPGEVDSLHIVVEPRTGRDGADLPACPLQLNPDAFHRSGPMGFTEALRCASDTAALVRFGHLAFAGLGDRLALFVAADDLPCDHPARAADDACTDMRREIERLRDEMRREVRVHLRSEIRGIREEMRR